MSKKNSDYFFTGVYMCEKKYSRAYSSLSLSSSIGFGTIYPEYFIWIFMNLPLS